MKKSELQAYSLYKKFGLKTAVKDITITMHQGEIVGLLGPNGAGKTTSFYIIAGFIKPNGGRVMIDDEDITDLAMYERAQKGIAYLPQDSSVFRKLSVEHNILAILEYHREYSKRERLKRLDELLSDLNITALRKQKADTLSGGERRRTEIARALANNPRFLLLDEPFTGIDPITVSDIKEIIRQLAYEKNIGILITEHNVRDTLEITNRSYIVNLGEIITHGDHEHLLSSDEARAIYLGDDFNM